MTNNLKTKLQEELAKDSPDAILVAELTNQLLDQNTDSIRFSVDAQHVQRLGFELVGKQETALSELIKNAYDADATQVIIQFENNEKAGGRLLISDDGLGMDSETIKRTWMRISTDDKLKSPLSPIFKRKKAGKKGIGRFAVQRLGKSLILETKIKDKSQGLRVHFEWDKDFIAGKDLNNVWNRIETFEKQPEDHGTSLIIEDLRDKWSEVTINKVWKSVLLLQPPHKISTIRQTDTIDPGFSVEINGTTSDDQKRIVSIEESFLDHATAEITGSIDKDGNAIFRVKSKKLALEDTHASNTSFSLTGPVSLEARYFIYASELMSGSSVRMASEMGHLYGGIRVYRDGFRVLPYGEQHDDWLNLARDTARRNLLIPANNTNFFGHVELNKEENILLEETAGREGLIENEAYEELRQFTRMCLEWAGLRIASARERKQSAGQKDFTSKSNKKPSEIIDEIIDDFEEDIEDDIDEKSRGEKTKKLFENLKSASQKQKEYENEQEKELEERIHYEAMLRILASLGLSISVFGHEIKGATNGVNLTLKLLEKSLDKLSDTSQKTELVKHTESVKTATNKVFDLGRYIDSLMGHAESRSLKSESVRHVIEEFSLQFNGYMNKQNIIFEQLVNPLGIRTCKIHRSELDSVLFNFLTNSIKALRKNNPQERKIRISAMQDNEYISIRFEDNGCGINDKHIEYIFDPFFTTADIDPEDEISGSGTGLGLKIVSDIAESYGGKVSIKPPSDGYNTCFEFRILAENKTKE
jgi:signal transduction histidine kinase